MQEVIIRRNIILSTEIAENKSENHYTATFFPPCWWNSIRTEYLCNIMIFVFKTLWMFQLKILIFFLIRLKTQNGSTEIAEVYEYEILRLFLFFVIFSMLVDKYLTANLCSMMIFVLWQFEWNVSNKNFDIFLLRFQTPIFGIFQSRLIGIALAGTHNTLKNSDRQ